MLNKTKNAIFLGLLVIFLAACAVIGPGEATIMVPEGMPVIIMTEDITVDQWLVVGPFPTESAEQRLSDGTFDTGYSKDFLGAVGGELHPKLSKGSVVEFMDENGQSAEAVVIQVNAKSQGIVDLAEVYNGAEYKVAYALAYVQSPKDQVVHFLVGSDDAVKVMVNGEMVHENYAFRGVTPGEDQFSINLKKGLNPIVVKVLNGTRGWGLSLSIIDDKTWAIQAAKETEKKEYEAFLNSRIIPDWYNSWDETFNPGAFPDMRWDQPYLAKKVIGDVPLKIRWFDVDLNEVQTAEKPGRYGFIAECTSKQGKTIQRAGTLYCYPWDWMGWSERPSAELAPIPAARFDPDIMKKHRKEIADYVGRMMLISTLDQEGGAALMSYLFEINHGMYADLSLTSPLLADDEYHIRLQKKIGGIKYTGEGLAPPAEKKGDPAPVLKTGTPTEAGFKPDIVKELKSVCDAWFAASGEPFITLVARNGIIVYEAASGGEVGREFTTDTATPVASVTKLITGVTFAQFVHQGLVSIDDPVGKYFPNFPLDGEKALTLRHCLTHTSGLVGHERWGGMHNHRLENVVANQLDYLPVGKKSTYNGDGYNMSGRVMEAISGKSIFRVIHENLIVPLELTNSSIEEDLAFSFQSTAGDLARIGQMLLNRGSYGEFEFFSPDVFDQILPKNLSQYYPGMDWDQGIGLTWMMQRHPQAGKNDVPEDKMILSSRIIGHGSATSTVLQVDLENNIVITQSRRQGGAQFEQYLTKLLLTIEKNLK